MNQFDVRSCYKFESIEVMEKGRDDWGMALCMSQSGNPKCHPEMWRSKKSASTTLSIVLKNVFETLLILEILQTQRN